MGNRKYYWEFYGWSYFDMILNSNEFRGIVFRYTDFFSEEGKKKYSWKLIMYLGSFGKIFLLEIVNFYVI